MTVKMLAKNFLFALLLTFAVLACTSTTAKAADPIPPRMLGAIQKWGAVAEKQWPAGSPALKVGNKRVKWSCEWLSSLPNQAICQVGINRPSIRGPIPFRLRIGLSFRPKVDQFHCLPEYLPNYGGRWPFSPSNSQGCIQWGRLRG